MSRFTGFVLTAFIIILITAPAQRLSAEAPDDQTTSTILISQKLLDDVDLKTSWQIDLPFKKKENIDRMFIFDDYLYVLTDNNYIFCINRKKGKTRFGLQLAAKGLPICDPSYYDSKLIFMIGNRMRVLDSEKGVIAKSKYFKRIGTKAVCSAVRNAEHIFVAGVNKRLHAFTADEHLLDFPVTADNDSMINSIIADDEVVVFSTRPGNVMCFVPAEKKRKWQSNIADGIVAPLVRDGISLYVSSIDSKLHKLSIINGHSAWKAPFQAGQPLQKSAQVGKNIVYQHAGSKGLYAISKADGKMVWQQEEGQALLAEVGRLAYIFVKPALLVIRDNITGKKLYSVNFADISDYAVNTKDRAIYVANGDGRVMSITPKE